MTNLSLKWNLTPMAHQKIFAILGEIVMMLCMLLCCTMEDSEMAAQELNLFWTIVSWAICWLMFSCIPLVIFFSKEYCLSDDYPLLLAEKLEEEGKLGKRARVCLRKTGVVFDKDEYGWYPVDYHSML